MFAPKGYRPVLELHLLAHEVAEAIANEGFDKSVEGIEHDEGTAEHLAELKNILSELVHRVALAKALIVDRFLKNQARLFLASPAGGVVEISKSVMLPFPVFYDDETAYLLNRDHSFSCLDTSLWVVDCEKLIESQRQIRALFDDLPDSANATLDEHKRFAEYIKSFDGWSLCIPESDFPKTVEPLKGLLRNTAEPEAGERSISKQILAITASKTLVKSDVRALFPRLSAREFDHHWKLAAQVNPDLSRPGRKS